MVFFRPVVLLIALLSVAPLAARQPATNDQEGPFVGITADGNVVPGLFSIEATNVSTAPIVAAAKRLLDTLDDAQRRQIGFPVDGDQWREWSNIHRAPRQGISFQDLDDVQTVAAIELISAAMSAKGLQSVRDIMRLNGHLARLTGKDDEYGEKLYWLAMMGTPSPTEPWGWQLEGHHLIVNYFVLADQVVMTPTFLGSEPVFAEDGPYKGIRVLQAEQNNGLRFLQSLSDNQLKKAVLGAKSGNNILTQAHSDNVKVPYAGLRASEMTSGQRDQFIDLIYEYIGNIREQHAAVRMQEILEYLDDTSFAWIGGTDEQSIFYYRIQSPVVLIEFDHQRPIALRNTKYTARDHVHSVVRTPNGNDYGKDILRQHYEQHRHDPEHGHVEQ